MEIEELARMCSRQWIGDSPVGYLSGEARFITGDHYTDLHLDQLEKKYGLRVIMTAVADPYGRKKYKIKNYEILDEKKFLMFMLRWS
jgi:hypothetical protein